MTAKPTLSPAWDQNATHTIAPISGHVSDGFVNNEVPSSAELNELLRRIGLIGDYIIAGDLELDGLKLHSATLSIANSAADLTPPAGPVVMLTGGGASAKITGITAPADSGRCVVLVNGTGSDVTLSALDSGTVAKQLVINDASVNAAIRLPKNAAAAFWFAGGNWICLWSSCPLVPALKVAQVPLAPAARFTNAGWVTDTENVHSTGTLWQFDSVSHGAWGLIQGDRIKRVSITLPTAGAGTYTVNLCKRDASGTGTIVQSFSTSSGTGSISTGWDVTSPVAIQVSERWFIQVLGPNNGDLLTDLHVQFDHPL